MIITLSAAICLGVGLAYFGLGLDLGLAFCGLGLEARGLVNITAIIFHR